jgi:glutathione S-transferase
MGEEPLTLVGAPGSPYSRKLRAVLRYRRIPFVWVQSGGAEARALPRPKVELLPQLVVRAASGELEARTDSTPLIRALEREHAGRAVIPADPVVAFVDALLEDYADEWLTKAMFHYRWAFAPDVAKAAALLPRWRATDEPEARHRELGRIFAERQIGRLGVVGSSAATAPVIEDGYVRLLRLLDAHLERSRFVMGARPGASDFALFGQLTQLAAFDPTPAAIALEVAPRVVAWLDLVEDLSGVAAPADGFFARDALPESLRALLAESGRVYAPFLLANADAVARGADRVLCTIDGRPFAQRPFPYQAKCLRWLREAHAALAPGDRTVVAGILAGTGLEALVAA